MMHGQKYIKLISYVRLASCLPFYPIRWNKNCRESVSHCVGKVTMW